MCDIVVYMCLTLVTQVAKPLHILFVWVIIIRHVSILVRMCETVGSPWTMNHTYVYFDKLKHYIQNQFPPYHACVNKSSTDEQDIPGKTLYREVSRPVYIFAICVWHWLHNGQNHYISRGVSKHVCGFYMHLRCIHLVITKAFISCDISLTCII